MATVVVVCGGREVKRRVRGKEEARALRRRFGTLSAGLLEPSWCSSRAFLGPLWQGSALRTTISREGGDDSQRVDRAMQSVHLVRAHVTLKNHIFAQKYLNM